MKAKNSPLKVKSQIVIVIFLFLFSGLISCNDDGSSDMESSQKIAYSGTFVKSSESVSTSATGSVKATFDPATLKLSYTITWSGLGSDATSMHFHNEAPVIIEITGFSNTTSGTVSGSATLSSQQATDLASGKIYAQIHTPDYPSGEVLATLTKDSSTPNNPGNGGGSGY